jgi:hypothetical protein
VQLTIQELEAARAAMRRLNERKRRIFDVVTDDELIEIIFNAVTEERARTTTTERRTN